MATQSPPPLTPQPRDDLAQQGALTDQALFRATGAPLIPGNALQLLRDAAENYPAWRQALSEARDYIYFENYIIRNDSVGREFADLLAEKARQGVRVRLLYDWMGALGRSSWPFWRRLRAAGVEVRGFNPPRLDSPFGWLSRDHRKTIVVDGRVAFVTGLCVGRMWVGDPSRGIAPWRDTGVALRGPAVAAVEKAFLHIWASTGLPPPDTDPEPEAPPPAGDIRLRVIPSQPGTAGLYRLDQMIAAGARQTLWLTDAYFLATSAYVQSLRAAALDGVDVRLLVPGASDLPLVRSLSRGIYRPLLEAGVRVFEWDGPMLHAKTAVADGAWTRIGSTNLNWSSWLSNWELDIAVEDVGFARQAQAMYLDDLDRSTEVVLNLRRHVRRLSTVAPRPKLRQPGSRSRAMAGALGLGSAVGAAITNKRALGPAEAKLMGTAGGLTLLLSLVTLIWPRLLTVPLAGLGVWLGVALLIKSRRLRRGQYD